jgi:hypothetical protein
LFPDFDKNRAHPLVQATMIGARKTRADAINRKAPLRPAHLTAFEERAALTKDYDDHLFVTILSCAFYGCHRMGELVVKNERALFDWRKVIKCGSLIFSHRKASYKLPYHKTDRFYRGTDIMFLSQDVADPVNLLKRYLALRDAHHGAKAALFIRRDGNLPTRSWFDVRFFTLLDRSFGGHSARAGGATFYASLGLSEDVIQTLGQW